MSSISKIALACALSALVSSLVASDKKIGFGEGGSVSPAEAWKQLREGNERFARNLELRPHANQERRIELAKGQHPFAVVIACSDSRVSPELLFDMGLGDLFVVRVAGNTAGSANVVGSVEYAVEHLGAKLIVVLGHQRCGAVTAAVKGVPKNDRSSVDELVAEIKPAADLAKDKVYGIKGDDLISEATERNVLHQMKVLLQKSPAVAEGVASKEFKLVSGVYNLDNSRVQWMGEHPSQREIIEGKKP